MKKILLAGATGYLGGFLLQTLVRQGFFVKALVRSSRKLIMNAPEAMEIIKGEITHPESMMHCCDQVETVISTVGITRQKDGLSYMDVDYQANLNLLKEAQRSGVKKFIYVSVLHGQDLRELKICEAKEKFVDALKISGLDYCIIRPTGFFPDMSEYLKMAEKGRVWLIGKGNARMNPIHGSDLATVCVAAIDESAREIAAGGPQIFTHNEMAALALGVMGKEVKITHLPDRLRGYILTLLRTFTSSKIYGPVEFGLTAISMDMIAPQFGHLTLNEYFRTLTSL